MNSIPIQLIYPDPFTDELVNANVCGPMPLPDDGLTDTFTGGCEVCASRHVTRKLPASSQRAKRVKPANRGTEGLRPLSMPLVAQ